MAGDPQFGPAPDLGSPSRAPFPPSPRDSVALRTAVDHALADGAGPGLVYASVVRAELATADATAGAGPRADMLRGLARSSANAALARLSERLPTTDEGAGRCAVVLVPPGPLGELDAHALSDALAADGWRPTSVSLDQDAVRAVGQIETLRAELALVPGADAAQVLASRRTCSLLRRLTAPPLVIGVSFDSPAGPPPVLAADHAVGSIDALAPLLRRRMGLGGGPVPWGVRLGRDGAGLTVSPGGILDALSVSRLREIVETRRTHYPRVVIDLRELLDIDGDGLRTLTAWNAEQAWSPTISITGDARTLQALDDAGLTGALPLTAPRRAL
jgi:hypothetical protein